MHSTSFLLYLCYFVVLVSCIMVVRETASNANNGIVSNPTIVSWTGNNTLTGTIPTELGTLSSLQNLYLCKFKTTILGCCPCGHYFNWSSSCKTETNLRRLPSPRNVPLRLYHHEQIATNWMEPSRLSLECSPTSPIWRLVSHTLSLCCLLYTSDAADE